MSAKPSIAFASVLMGALAALSVPADAACKKFGFTVNDYGKDGPTNDAKNLLDKHISEFVAQNKIGEYSTGKKTVSCELFLDVILFDEHTCTASATVCWGADAKKLGNQSAAAPAEEGGAAGAPPAPVRKAHALGHATQQAAAPAEAAPAAGNIGQVEAAPSQPVEQLATESPAAAPAAPAATAPATQAAAPSLVPDTSALETGALQAGQGLQQPAQKPAASGQDRAAAAAAAASAAQAAERAAMAAETAANAAKEAAAAAVAASAASKHGATVPPLDHASGAKPVHNE
jgi:hypothetical protein